REPGWVDVTVIAQPTAIGVYHNETDVKRVRAIALAMDQAGMPTVFTDDIARVLWAKVAYNCALNPLSAMLNAPYGAMVKSEGTMNIMREVIGELYAVAKAMNVALEPATAEAYFDHFVNVLIPPTAAHYASMHADLAHGRRTEIDALNGAIWKYGREHGVPCPANAFLTNLIHGREQLSGHGTA
ncbi:MAG: 2-dehydropantoate 2-reductase, partial [Candidatus Hydrogenedentes bacterium]|nr:2-dehydropantoate 2-reductase [Candidatus Hydrogenedentota bacterium]